MPAPTIEPHTGNATMRVFERHSARPATAEVDLLVNGCFDSAAYREGRRAFTEKRTPVFNGR